MNVTIIYGTMSKGNTYNCVQLLLDKLKSNININVTEFFLPKDSPYFCRGCFSDLINNKNKHLHFNHVHSIAESLDKSDLIIFASPVFTCDISLEMKSLLYHLSYNYNQTETNALIGKKIGLAMSTTASAGLFYTTKTLIRNLSSLGIKNIFKFSQTIYEMDWEHMNLRTKKKIDKKISKLSNKISNLYNKTNTIKVPIFNEISMFHNKPIQKENQHNVINFNYLKKTNMHT